MLHVLEKHPECAEKKTQHNTVKAADCFQVAQLKIEAGMLLPKCTGNTKMIVFELQIITTITKHYPELRNRDRNVGSHSVDFHPN